MNSGRVEALIGTCPARSNGSFCYEQSAPRAAVRRDADRCHSDVLHSEDRARAV